MLREDADIAQQRCLTEAGRACLDEVMTRVRGRVANAITQLDVNDQRHLHDLLHRLTGVMREA